MSLSPKSKLPVKDLAHQLLLLGEERGVSASGWAYEASGSTFSRRSPRPGHRMPVNQIDPKSRNIILHTRNMTKGEVTDPRNNHPVLSPDKTIHLIHNGIVKNDENMREHFKDADLGEVDSAVIPALIQELGVHDAMQQIEGWAAVAWLDSQTPGTIHLARLNEAPLILVALKDGSMLFASTFGMIKVALERVGKADQIEWGYEVSEWTYLRLTAGKITHMHNLAKYTYTDSLFKVSPAKAKTKAQQDKEDAELRAKTMGSIKPPTTAAPPVKTPPLHTQNSPVYRAGGSWERFVPGKGWEAAEPPAQRVGAYVPPYPPLAITPAAPKIEVPYDPSTVKDRLGAIDWGAASTPGTPAKETVYSYTPRGAAYDENFDDEALDAWLARSRTSADGYTPTHPGWPEPKWRNVATPPAEGELIPAPFHESLEDHITYWIKYRDGDYDYDLDDYEDFVICHLFALEEGYLDDRGYISALTGEMMSTSTATGMEMERAWIIKDLSQAREKFGDGNVPWRHVFPSRKYSGPYVNTRAVRQLPASRSTAARVVPPKKPVVRRASAPAPRKGTTKGKS